MSISTQASSNTAVVATEVPEVVPESEAVNFEDVEDIEVVEELVTVDVTDALDCSHVETEITVDTIVADHVDPSLTFDEQIVSTPEPTQQPMEETPDAEKPAPSFVFKNPNFVVSCLFVYSKNIFFVTRG